MTKDLFDLSGRVAIVTGAGTGLGKAMAGGLAAFGADIAVFELDEETGRRTVAEIEELGVAARFVGCDVSDAAAVDHAVATVEETLGPVAILVNNAARISHVKPELLTLSEWSGVVDVNLTGSFICAQAVARRMIPRGRGAIVNMASIGGLSAVGRGNLVYDVTKAGVVQMTKDLAVEWARHGIRVNAIAPCGFKTEAWQSVIDHDSFDGIDIREAMLRGIPLGRFGELYEMVGPAVFLVSDAASMVTGVTLPVDGGNIVLNAGGTVIW